MKSPVFRNRFLSFLICALSAAATARAQEPGIASAASFLRAHREALPESLVPAPHLGLIRLDGVRVFLVGELLGVADTNPTDLALLDYLNRVAGVRTYVGELSYAHAALLNRYLATGDTRILDFIFKQMEGSNTCSVQKRQSWIDLRNWNLSLPPDRRIRIVGVDFERFRPELTLAYLRDCLRGSSSNAAAAQALGLLHAAGPNPSPERAHALTDGLAALLRRRRADFAAALGPNLYDFAFGLRNLEDRFRCFADRARFDELRDRVMYDNLVRQERHRPLGVIFCRIGSGHVLQRRFDGMDRLGGLLAGPGSPWSGAVASFFPLYVDSKHLATVGGFYHPAGCDDDPRLLAPFAREAMGRATLFRLTGAGSPFARDVPAPGEAWRWGDNQLRYCGRSGPGDEGRLFGGLGGGVATDYFQYVVLFSGATANARFVPPASGG